MLAPPLSANFQVPTPHPWGREQHSSGQFYLLSSHITNKPPALPGSPLTDEEAGPERESSRPEATQLPQGRAGSSSRADLPGWPGFPQGHESGASQGVGRLPPAQSPRLLGVWSGGDVCTGESPHPRPESWARSPRPVLGSEGPQRGRKHFISGQGMLRAVEPSLGSCRIQDVCQNHRVRTMGRQPRGGNVP